MATLMQLMQSAFSYESVTEKKQERQDHFHFFCSSNFYNKFTIIFSSNVYHIWLASCNFKVYWYTYRDAINTSCLN